MKSLGVVALALLCVALFVYAIKNVLSTAQEWDTFTQDTARLFTAIEVERIVRDSNAVILARLDSVHRAGQVVAQRHQRERSRLSGERDSLRVVLGAAQSAPESLLIASRTNEVLDSALGVASKEIDALRVTVESQAQLLAIGKLENDRLWGLVDSASRVIRSTPKCPRIPLLGLRMPVFGPSYAVTTAGSGFGVAGVIPIAGC